MAAADATAGVHRLRAAVWDARTRDDWLSSDEIVFDVVQGSIVRWVDDVGRSIKRLTVSLRSAEDGTDLKALEDALIQVVSARDKLRAVTVRVLDATESLELYKDGVRFNPTERSVRRILGDVAASGVEAAGRTKSLFEQLADHPAVILRNEIIHSLAPFPELADVCWIKTAYLDDRGGIVGWDRGPLYFEGSLELENALPETLLGWALGSAEDARTLLLATTDALAEVVEKVGMISPLPSCYRGPDGDVRLTDPRGPSPNP